MSTRQEIVAFALEEIGVSSADEAPTAEDYTKGSRFLDAAFAELQSAWGGCTFTFTPDNVSDEYIVPLSRFLAVRLAQSYTRPAPEPEKTALVRIRAINLPYTRDMDLDEDGTTTDDETLAFDQGTYF